MTVTGLRIGYLGELTDLLYTGAFFVRLSISFQEIRGGDWRTTR